MPTPCGVVPHREVWGEFVDVVERHSQGRTPVLVAHNGFLFDNPLVLLACWRDGVRVPDHWLTVDSLFVAKQLPREAVGPSLRLQDLNVHFGLPAATAAHQAWEDTEVLARVWSNLFAHLQIHEQLSRSGLPTGAGEEAEALATYMAEHAAAPGHSRTTAKHTTWADTWPNFGASLGYNRRPCRLILPPDCRGLPRMLPGVRFGAIDQAVLTGSSISNTLPIGNYLSLAAC